MAGEIRDWQRQFFANEEVASLPPARWNQIVSWLRQIELLGQNA
jgi:hypothetical protein